MSKSPFRVAARRAAVLFIGALAAFIVGCPRRTPSNSDDAPQVGDDPVLDRGTIYVDIKETLDGEPTQPNISRHLIETALLLNGFQLVDTPDAARYRVEGNVECEFDRELTLDLHDKSQHVEWKYKGSAFVTATDTVNLKQCKQAGLDPEGEAGPLAIEHIDVPQDQNGRIDREDAKKDIRRSIGTIVAKRIAIEKMFGNPTIEKLIWELGDPNSVRTFNDVIDDLTAIGMPVVPRMLRLFDDTRPVRLKGQYPGLEDWNRDSLRYYHIADRVLSDVLLRDSGLSLDSTEGYRIGKVALGWTWAWEDLQHIPEPYRIQPEKRKSTIPAPVGN